MRGFFFLEFRHIVRRLLLLLLLMLNLPRILPSTYFPTTDVSILLKAVVGFTDEVTRSRGSWVQCGFETRRKEKGMFLLLG